MEDLWWFQIVNCELWTGSWECWLCWACCWLNALLILESLLMDDNFNWWLIDCVIPTVLVLGRGARFFFNIPISISLLSYFQDRSQAISFLISHFITHPFIQLWTKRCDTRKLTYFEFRSSSCGCHNHLARENMSMAFLNTTCGSYCCGTSYISSSKVKQ